MSRDALQGFLRLGVFVGGLGLLMALVQKPGSAEFVVSVCSALIGGMLILGVVLLIRTDFFGWLERLAARRGPPPDEPPDHRQE
jgi:hypothetical protein